MRVKGKRVLKNGVVAGYVKQKDGSWKWRFLGGPKKKGGDVTDAQIEELLNCLEEEICYVNKTEVINLFVQELISSNPISNKKTLKERVSRIFNKIWSRKCGGGVGKKNNRYTNANSAAAGKNINQPRNINNSQGNGIIIEFYEFYFGSRYFDMKQWRRPRSVPRKIKGIKRRNDQNLHFYNGNKEGDYYKEYSNYPIYSHNVITHSNEVENEVNNFNKYHEYYKEQEVIKPQVRETVESYKDIIILLRKAYNLQNNRIEGFEEGILNNLDNSFIMKLNLENNDKVITFGDLHGSFHTFYRLILRLIHSGILERKTPDNDAFPTNWNLQNDENRLDIYYDDYILKDGYYMLFCGDIFDRGQYSLEIVILLIRLILNNPGRIIYNRGNHEHHNVWSRSGHFNNELMAKFNIQHSQEIKVNLINFLRTCPSAVILNYPNKKIWCCHGGVPFIQENSEIEPLDLRTFLNDNTQNYYLLEDKNGFSGFGISYQVRWNDLTIKPRVTATTTYRSRSVLIGFEGIRQFNELNKIDYVIRGHQDSYANNVLFCVNPNIKPFQNGTDLDELIYQQQELNKSNKTKKFSTLESKFDIDGINPLANLQIFTKGRKKVSVLTSKINNDEKNEVLTISPGIETSIEAITISTNTDLLRGLTKDSFIIVSAN